jgi:ornithine decarboxylase
MQSYFKLTRPATEALADKYGTPLLVLSLDQVRANYRFLSEHLPGVKVHYAVKANPERRLVGRWPTGLVLRCRLDGEMSTCGDGVAPTHIYANPSRPGAWRGKRTGVNSSL